VTADVSRSFGKSNAANSGAPSRPGLNLSDDLAAKFFGRNHGVVRIGDGAAARDPESVRGEDGFALIFVESRHG
jgi:hypothetical protein